MTRTVYLGKPRAKERAAYEAVLEAQEAGVQAVRSGASCGEVDEAARGVLRKAGLAEAFSHSTGHGVGLEIHESPRIGAGQKTRLLAGMVVTIEPGIYSGRRVWHPHRRYGGCNANRRSGADACAQGAD
jgi:Xaa-Pro aminopeptidase